MRQPYTAPRLIAYGRIADCTFRTPTSYSTSSWWWWWGDDDGTEGTGS